MKRDQLEKLFAKVLKPGTDSNWPALRAARQLPPGLDPAFVRKVFDKLLSEDSAIQTFGGTLTDEYVPIARAVLARKKTSEAIFLSHVSLASTPAGFRAAVKTLDQLGTQATRKKIAYARKIAAEPAYVSAAQTAVAAKGTEAWLQMIVLAYDGSAESADVLLPLVIKALAEKGEELDFFVQLLDDRSLVTATMKPIFDALDAAQNARAKLAKVGDLAERFGGERASFVLELGFESNEPRGGPAKLHASFSFFARRKPSAEVYGRVSSRMNELHFDWTDGKMGSNKAKFPRLESLDGIPAWMAAIAKKHRCTWNRTPQFLTSSLRGKARAALLDWLLGT